MPDTTARLLIVDDEPSIRTSMSHVLTEIGYGVRTANDGFAALRELRQEVPDIVLSDLNMPGMSGFELLTVVRRRFPAVHTIAMSGAFQGDEVPSGVAADAFYQKGSSIGSLLRIMEALPQMEPRAAQLCSTTEPVWVERAEHGSSGLPYAMIECPECLRSFPQPVGSLLCLILYEASCVFCRSSIRFVIVEPADRAASQVLQRKPAEREQTPAIQPQFYY
ncbi:MAG: response regulator [Terracidiphilus sp.]|nr:response regulator [Terracidiphilus sp.]